MLLHRFETQLNSWLASSNPNPRNSMVYVLGQSRVWFSLFYTQPKNPKNVVSLEIGLMHVLVDV